MKSDVGNCVQHKAVNELSIRKVAHCTHVSLTRLICVYLAFCVEN